LALPIDDGDFSLSPPLDALALETAVLFFYLIYAMELFNIISAVNLNHIFFLVPF